MKLYLVGACLATALLLQTQLMAQAPPHFTVEVVTPGHDKWEHLLDLSTSHDTVDLTVPSAKSLLQAEVGPPHYDYRAARRVERKYNHARRYYTRKNRHDTKEIQKGVQRARVGQAREMRRERKQQKKEAGKQPVRAEQKPRSRH